MNQKKRGLMDMLKQAVDEKLEREITHFLYREAELLDNRQLHDWFSLLTSDIDYKVPVRTTREQGGGNGFSERAFFMNETYGTMKARVLRFDSEFAWSENPPTRTRRMVNNVRVVDSTGDEVSVFSNMAVFCFKGDQTVPVILTGERQDVIRRVGGEWKLAKRLVLLDTTVLGMHALSIFL